MDCGKKGIAIWSPQYRRVEKEYIIKGDIYSNGKNNKKYQSD